MTTFTAAAAAAARELVLLHEFTHCFCLLLYCCIAAMELKKEGWGHFERCVAVSVDCFY
jgi:hypothetical protein